MEVRAKADSLLAPLTPSLLGRTGRRGPQRGGVAILVLLLYGLGTGCSVGEYGPDTEIATTPDAMTTTTNNAAGEASFNSTIKPLVMTNCVSCHNGSTPPNLTSFSALQAKYKMKPGMTNVLVTKGNHAGIQYFGATDKTAVQNWIDSL
jgi:hypothetical protein